MKKRYIDKVVQFISEDNLPKLKSYTRKHGVDLSDVLIDDGGTLLHLACRLGHDDCMRYLLKVGVDCSLCNRHGDLPLHLAAKLALSGNQHAYPDLVKPLIKAYPDGLHAQNNGGVTPRSMIEHITTYNMHYTEQEESSQNDENDFTARLASEMEHEFTQHFGRYETDYSYENEYSKESFRDWLDRIRHEKHNKDKKHSYKSKHSRKKDKGEREKEKKCFQKKLEEEHAEYVRKNTKKQSQDALLLFKKKRFEENWSHTFQKTEKDKCFSYSDIPWPNKGGVENIMKVLVCDIDLETDYESIKKKLKKEQVRWHPDKFQQKFGSRLLDSDKDRIMKRVKTISQALNQLIDKHRSS